MTAIINSSPRLTSSVEVAFSWTPAGTFSYTAPNGIALTSPSAVAHEAVTFTATTVIDNQGVDLSGALTIIEYHWDFGDGTEGYGSSVSHVYQLPNLAAQAVLRVTDSQGRRWYGRRQMFLTAPNHWTSVPSGALSFTGGLTRQKRRLAALSGALAATGSLATVKTGPKGQSMSGTLSSAGSINRIVRPRKTASLGLTGNLVAAKSGLIPAFVRQNLNGGSGTGTTKTTGVVAAPAATNRLIMIVRASNGASVSSVTDTKGNTWVVDLQGANTTFVRLAVISTPQDVGTLTTSDTITVTISQSTSMTFSVLEYSNLIGGSTGYLDGTGATSFSGTAGTTGSTSMTTTGTNSLVFTLAGAGTTSETFTYPTGFTARTTGQETATLGGGALGAADEVGSAGTYTGGWSWNTSAAWSVGILAYKAL